MVGSIKMSQGACKIVPNNEIGFRSGNRCGKVEEQTRVTKTVPAEKVPATQICGTPSFRKEQWC